MRAIDVYFKNIETHENIYILYIRRMSFDATTKQPKIEIKYTCYRYLESINDNLIHDYIVTPKRKKLQIYKKIQNKFTAIQ